MSMRWDGKGAARPMKQDRQKLARDLTALSEALETDHSPGEALPMKLYWDLRYKARDGLKFLERRRST